jgi:hypothetical protein
VTFEGVDWRAWNLQTLEDISARYGQLCCALVSPIDWLMTLRQARLDGVSQEEREGALRRGWDAWKGAHDVPQEDAALEERVYRECCDDQGWWNKEFGAGAPRQWLLKQWLFLTEKQKCFVVTGDEQGDARWSVHAERAGLWMPGEACSMTELARAQRSAVSAAAREDGEDLQRLLRNVGQRGEVNR